MFSDELEKISWEETTKAIYSRTEADVIRALGKSRCDVDDFMALISPAAEKFLEPMARLSKKYTEERFGRTMSMFIPLYITNSCTNSCVYCGFHISNPMARTILTPEEIENEYKAIKKLGPFENLLIVTGENPAKAGVPYIAKALDLAKPYFSNLKIEVMPLKTEEYAELVHHGLNGVICFQETYNKARYNVYHPRGMKSKFEWRVNGFDRMGQAGVHSIGIPLAVSGRQTFIVPSASMTVHPVRMSGLMIAAPQSYRYFERVQESIVSFVARHSRITQDDFRQLMLADGDMSNDVGTILYGSQAVQLGLIDRLGTLSDALEALYGMIGKNG